MFFGWFVFRRKSLRYFLLELLLVWSRVCLVYFGWSFYRLFYYELRFEVI